MFLSTSFARPGLAAPCGILGPDGFNKGARGDPTSRPSQVCHFYSGCRSWRFRGVSAAGREPGPKTKAAPPEAGRAQRARPAREARSGRAEGWKEGGDSSTPLQKYEVVGQRK